MGNTGQAGRMAAGRAALQPGTLSHAQAIAAGLTHDEIDDRVATGR